MAEIKQQILEANGWSELDAQQLEIGQKVIVPMEFALDEALLEESAGKVADEASSKAGEIAEAASSETPEVDAPANVNYTKIWIIQKMFMKKQKRIWEKNLKKVYRLMEKQTPHLLRPIMQLKFTIKPILIYKKHLQKDLTHQQM